MKKIGVLRAPKPRGAGRSLTITLFGKAGRERSRRLQLAMAVFHLCLHNLSRKPGPHIVSGASSTALPSLPSPSAGLTSVSSSNRSSIWIRTSMSHPSKRTFFAKRSRMKLSILIKILTELFRIRWILDRFVWADHLSKLAVC